jgi:hypothetical protein
MGVERRKRPAFKINRDDWSASNLTSRQYGMRDEIFSLNSNSVVLPRCLISPQYIFETCHFEWHWKFWSPPPPPRCETGQCSHQSQTLYPLVTVYLKRYSTQVVFPSGRCPVTSTCSQFDSRAIYGGLHRSLIDPLVSVIEHVEHKTGSLLGLEHHGSHRVIQ